MISIFNRFALKQEGSRYIYEYRKSQIPNMEWGKRALSWPTDSNGNLIHVSFLLNLFCQFFKNFGKLASVVYFYCISRCRGVVNIFFENLISTSSKWCQNISSYADSAHAISTVRTFNILQSRPNNY